MKNVKKLLKKATVWAVAASMLIATPLTASAAGIRGVFSVSDGTDIIKDNGTDTGTVTNTNTNTSVLSENEARIIGIALDQAYVNTEIGKRPVLNATVILDGAEDEPELVEAINGLIRWETSDLDKLSVDAKASDRTVATLKPKKAANVGEEVKVTVSIGGKYPFTWTNKETGEEIYVEGSDVYHEAVADVFIKEYANKLSFTKKAYGEDDGILVKHNVDMNQWLIKDPSTANDNVTWSISKTNAATISDNGVVTVKKFDAKKAENNKFVVTAVSEKGAKASAELTVGAGTPASKVEAYEVAAGKEDVLLKGTKKVDVGGADPVDSIDVKAVMYAKVDTTVKNKEELKDGSEYTPKGESASKTLVITDNITWASNKSAIVSVEDHGDGTATLEPLTVGTAKITATATSGKKASFSVKVDATLTGLTVAVYPETAYTGQTVTLKEERTPSVNKSALVWSAYSDAKGEVKSKDVSINSKGVMKVKNTLKTNEVYVKVESKKDKVVSPLQKIDLEQSSISDIAVRDDNDNLVTRVWFEGTKTKKDGTAKTDIRVPKDRVYTVQVGKDDVGGAESLNWTYPTNNKVIEVLSIENGVAKFHAVGKGTAKITVSGVNVTKRNDDGSAKSTKAIKTTFTVNVIQPTTSVALNKTDIVLYEKSTKNGIQDQTVSLKATLNPKGAADPVSWKVYKNGELAKSGTDYDATKTKATGKNNVNYKLVMKAPAIGDVYKVTATAQTGVSRTAEIKILRKPVGIEIHKDAESHTQFTEKNPKNGKTIANTKYVVIGESFEMYPEVNVGESAKKPTWVAAGKDNTESVTYTQSGKGKVIIIGNMVYGVKEGKVTITAKTPNNKKTTLKVEVQP